MLAFNHQSLIATKANRCVRAAQGRPVLEFGSRRAQGADGAIIGARAAISAAARGLPARWPTSFLEFLPGGTMATFLVQMLTVNMSV